MPLTVVINAWSIAYPTISNRIRAEIRTQADLSTIITSQIDAVPGHPQRKWSFPGLPRTNYNFQLNVIDGSDNPIQNLANFDLVPDEISGLMVRDDEQIFPGVTPGVPEGVNHVKFDGSGSTGTDIQLNQQGTLSGGGTYSWYFTLKGTTLASGASVTVEFTWNDGSDHDSTVTANATDGESIDDLVADLLAQIVAINPNAVAYTDTDGKNGVRVRSLTVDVGGVVTIHNVSGTGTSPDYRGWNINPERRAGGGTMIRGVEYSWDIETGDFYLLQAGDILQHNELINIDFDPQETTAGGSTGDITTPAFSVRVVTEDDNILSTDFGNKIIGEPAAQYLKLTLPAAAGIQANLPVSIECSGTDDCTVEVATQDAPIKFAWGKIFLCKQETIKIYKLDRGGGVFEWRVDVWSGNFLMVGRIVFLDSIEAQTINCLPLDGRTVNILQYARLNDMRTRLSAGQIIPFASWSTNETYYSSVSGDEFHIPNREALYARPSANQDPSVEGAGRYWRMSLERHKHIAPFGSSFSPPFGNSGAPANKLGSGSEDFDNYYMFTNDGTPVPGLTNQPNPNGVFDLNFNETRPNSYSINQYVLI